MSATAEILLYGPPLSGKSTILEQYAARSARRSLSFDIQTVGHPLPESGYRVVSDDGSPLAATIPGAVWTMASWSVFMAAAAGLLVVLDPQESRRAANQEYLDCARSAGTRIVGLQITKADLVGHEKAETVAREAAEYLALDVPRALSTIRDPRSLSRLLEELI